MQQPIPSLTGLRFVAAICVVFAHAIPAIVRYEDAWGIITFCSRLSAEGMTLFFVLSGFVIYYNYAESVGTLAGFYNFFVARFARLYPLYFVAVSYDLLIKVSYSQLPTEKLVALPLYAALTQSWFYLPIGDNALIYQFGLMPQVSWSISTEWFFYLAFPVAAFAIGTIAAPARRFVAAGMLMLSALAMLAVLHTNASAISRYGVDTFGPLAADQQDSFLRWLLYFSPYVRIFEFLLGCLTASIYVQLKPGRAGGQIFGAWLTAAALASVALSYWAMFSGVGGRWQPFLLSLHMNFGFAPSMALLIFCCASFDNAFSRLMSARLAVLCGEASYSIYLLHFLIVSAFHHEAPIIVSRRQIAGSALQLVVVLAAIMGLSLISWATIEVPARRWIRRRLTLALAHPNAPRSP